MSHIIVATGVQREAITLSTVEQVVIPGGGDETALRRKLEASVEDAIGIISFGLGGALAPSLRIGDWVIGEQLVGSVEASCDRDWISALHDRNPRARIGTIYSDGRLVSAAGEKAELAERYGALAVDMESHVAASVAASHGLPFAVLRCVSDTSRATLPPAIAVAMRPDGTVNGPAMLRSLVTKPLQLPFLIGSITGFLKAMRALKKHGGVITQPYSRTTLFERVSLVSRESEVGADGLLGWGFDVFGDSYSQPSPYRPFLERLSDVTGGSHLDLPSWEENEDCIEGLFDWRGAQVRVYYETLLDYMNLRSNDQNTIAELREEIIRLAGRASK